MTAPEQTPPELWEGCAWTKPQARDLSPAGAITYWWARVGGLLVRLKCHRQSERYGGLVWWECSIGREAFGGVDFALDDCITWLRTRILSHLTTGAQQVGAKAFVAALPEDFRRELAAQLNSETL